MNHGSNEDLAQKLDQIQRDIAEIKKTMRLFMLQSRKEIGIELDNILDTPVKRNVYELTDGQHSAREIAMTTRISITTVHKWWNDWLRLGIVSRVTANGRSIVTRNFSIKDFGMEVPDIESTHIKPDILEIPSKKELRSILGDSSMFQERKDVVEFAQKFFEFELSKENKDPLDQIIDLFFDSPKRKQMLFLQALRQQAECKGSRFKDYFEFWERHIKSEV